MLVRKYLLLLVCCFWAVGASALSGREHWADMQRIFPFDEVSANKPVLTFYRRVNTYLDNPYIQPGERHVKGSPKRPKFIVDHPKFSQIHWRGKHRIWFHWGFNTDPRKFTPIVESLQDAVSEGIIGEADVTEFWSLMNDEISRRNRALMNEGAKVFGFGELGTISAAQRRQLNGFVTMLYSIHILGDHQTTDHDIIVSLNRLYADIYSAIDNIAGKQPQNYQKAKELKKQLKPYEKDPKAFLDALQRYFSPFLMSLSGEGYNYKAKFRSLGYVCS